MPKTTGKWNRLSSYKTKIARFDNGAIVTYQTTNIVEFNAERVHLDTGGWQSVTTKRKMNQAANQFDLGYSVTQVNHVWWIWTKAGRFRFEAESFTFDRATGIPVGATFSEVAVAASFREAAE